MDQVNSAEGIGIRIETADTTDAVIASDDDGVASEGVSTHRT